MSTDIQTATSSQAPDVMAIKRLGALLGFDSLKVKDLPHLKRALAEAAAEEIMHNPEFAAQVRSRFETLILAIPTNVGNGRPKKHIVQLTPIGRVDPTKFSAHAPWDPYALKDLYGDDQLADAMSEWGMAELKQAVTLVQQRHPEAKPLGRPSKAAYREFITRYVRGT